MPDLMTKETIGEIIDILKSCKCPKEQAWSSGNDKIMTKRYLSVLSDKPEWVGKWLLLEINRQWEWRPEPAQIHQAAQAKMGLAPPCAADAWTRLQQLARRYGEYGLVVEGGVRKIGTPRELTDDPLLSRAARVLGVWPEILDAMDSNPTATRAHFIQNYERIIAEVKSGAPPPYRQLDTAKAPQALDRPALTAPPRAEKLPDDPDDLEDIDYDN